MEKGICEKDIVVEIIEILYEDISSDDVGLLYSAYETKDDKFNY